MSGYKVGIAIVILLIIIGGLAVWLKESQSSRIGPPTEATAGYRFMRPIELARTPMAFMPLEAGHGAGHIYLAAYRYLLKEAPDHHTMNQIDDNAYPNKNPVILHLAKMLEKAAGLKVSRQFILFDKRIPMPNIKHTTANNLEVISTALSDLGEAYLVTKHPNQAKVVFGAVMSFGYRLWLHGLLVNIRSTGLGAMSSATAGLKQLYSTGELKNRTSRHEVDAFQRDLRTTTHRWLSKMGVIVVIDPNPGDMANVVRHDQDVSWKLAAINELGIDRWATTSAGQRKAIIKLLTRLEHNTNPYIQQAAHNALSLTTVDINEM
ncbi:MAG: hypothetical protein ACP5O1_06235 [Phycisphaerae bacterium]